MVVGGSSRWLVVGGDAACLSSILGDTIVG